MANRLTISTIAAQIAESTGRSKKSCEDFVKEFFKLAGEGLAEGENLRIKGFGNFKISEVEARSGVNVSNGEKQEIMAHRKIVFTPSKEMSALINAPFEAFESIELDDDMPSFENVDDPEPEAPILEAGSDEEEFDDEITYEAYSLPDSKPEEKTESIDIPEERQEIEPAQAPEPHLSEGLNEEKQETLTSQNVIATTDNEESKVETVYVTTPDRYGRGFFAGAMTSLATCLIIFMLGCFFNWWPVNFGSTEKYVEEAPVEEVADSQPEVVESPAPEPEPVVDTVSTTRYLTTIAREHYGNFNFWPYIYLENEEILGHPDRITPGTKVVVPPLSKYGVDPNNKEDEEIAKKKGFEIYRKFM